MPHGRLWAGVIGLLAAVAALVPAARGAEPQLFPPGTGGLNGPGDVSPASATSAPGPGAPAPPTFLPKSAPAVQPAPQPVRQPVAYPGSQPASQPIAQPAVQPAVQPAQPGFAPGSQTLSFSTEPVVKDLTPVGFADLIPPDPHHDGGHHGHVGHGHEHAAHCDPCGEHHEIPEYLTPFVTDHRGFYGSAEFLLFRPRNSDFDYAIANTTAGLATTGPIDSLKYDTGTGVRAEVGYRYAGRWETAFAYTYFTGGADRALSVPTGQVLFPTLTRPGLTDRALVALANADLDYQLFDMTAGRRFVLDENFALRALGGFRFADLRQTLNAVYDGVDARRAAITTRSRFQGFGPIVGGEALLVGWKGFHLYSRATGGLLTGRSDNRLIETNDAGATTYINTRYNVRKVVPTATIAIGGGWQYRTVSIRAGYEVTYWHGVFERPRFVDDVSQGKVITRPSNLSLEGFFLQFGWAF